MIIHPLKQGLKRGSIEELLEKGVSHDYSSTKTRIETVSEWLETTTDHKS